MLQVRRVLSENKVHSSVKNKVERDVEKAIAFTERMRRLFVGRKNSV